MLRAVAPAFASPMAAGAAPSELIPICTAHGIVYAPLDDTDGDPQKPTAEDGCDCCLPQAVDVPAATLPLAGMAWRFLRRQPIHHEDRPAAAPDQRHDTIRAPPNAFFSL
jgi:hypothetical protein